MCNEAVGRKHQLPEQESCGSNWNFSQHPGERISVVLQLDGMTEGKEARLEGGACFRKPAIGLSKQNAGERHSGGN